jgi:hypothetical protein
LAKRSGGVIGTQLRWDHALGTGFATKTPENS